MQGVALVKNLSDHGGQTLTVVFNYYDAADSLVKTETQVEGFSWAGQTLAIPTFSDLGNKRTKVVRSEATLKVEDQGAFEEGTAAALPVVEGVIVKDQYNGWVAKFELGNATDQPLNGLRVGVICRNDAGKVIGGASEYPDLIAAGSKVLVEADVTTSGKPATCTAYPNHGF